LIDDLLDISRIITGKLRLEVRTIELSTVIEAAANAVRPAAEAKDIRLQILLDTKVGPVSGDSDRLQQVFLESSQQRRQVHSEGRSRAGAVGAC
jgi:signal transduction histidine kinase